MEISAIMNIHELAVEQIAKQKTVARVNRKRKDPKDESMMGEAKNSKFNRLQQTNKLQETQKETSETGRIVNLAT
jgi:hypothetical protein